ncbi:MAG: MATE family efflux transporter [Oscillospiraceae bacterium]|nr:MATE family efflux transporter [Oscillospiraceae bacterium]
MNPNNSLVTGNVGKRLITFSAPIILANLIQAIYGFVDMMVVGRYIGSAGMSAVSMGAQITAVVMILVGGFSNGGTIISAQLFGRGAQKDISRVLGTMLSFFAIIAVIATVGLIIFARPLLTAINTPEIAFEQAVEYFLICIIGTIFVYAYNSMGAVLRGVGNSTVPMIIVIITVILNAILDVLLIVVIPMGVAGAAIATITCQFISMVMISVYIKTKTEFFDFKLASFKIDKTYLKLIVKIGLPQSIQFLFASSSAVFLSGLVNIYGVYASAASGAVAKIQTLANLPAQGMMAGLLALTAQNLAANEPKRVMKGMFTGMLFAGAISLVVYALCFIFPTQAFLIFTPDTAVIEAGIDYLKLLAISFVLESFMFCMFGVISGAGYTPLTMCCGILSAFVARYASAWFLSQVLMMGFNGIGLSYVVGPIISSAICIAFLLTGKWKKPRVQVG